MTNEERDLIARYIARVGGAPQGGGFMGGGQAPGQPALPPIDPEADAFIAQQFQQVPQARYRITQTAIVQEAALAEAQNRIQRLEWELQQARQAATQPQAQQPQGGFAQPQPQRGGIFGGLFGGGQQAPQPQFQQPQYAPPPQPQYPAGYRPGMFQGGGSGFLGSALTTAAGVAGGMVVGNALMNAFGGHGGAAAASAASFPSAASSPWGSLADNSASSSPSPFDGAGYTPTDPTAGFGNQAAFNDPFGGGGAPKDDPGSIWDQGGTSDSGFDSAGGFDGGGDSGGGFDDNA